MIKSNEHLDDLFGGFFELIMTTFLGMEICQGSILEDLTTFGTFYALER